MSKVCSAIGGEQKCIVVTKKNKFVCEFDDFFAKIRLIII